MNTIDLFSGTGGISLGLKSICKTVAYCEIDPLCVQILKNNMALGNLDTAEIFDDVTTLNTNVLKRLKPMMLTAGFPCQDISIANVKGKGLKGEKSSMFYHILRIVDGLPSIKCVFMENSSNILNKGLSTIKKEFVSRGWSVTWTLTTACEAGLPHIRRRWVCMACAKGFHPPCSTPTHYLLPKEPSRVIKYESIAKRCGTLGNAVVPHCMIMSFNILASMILGHLVLVKKGVTCEHISKDGKTIKGFREEIYKCPSQKLHFSDKGNPLKFTRKYWVTPLKSAFFWSKYLTIDPINIQRLPCETLHEKETAKQIVKIVGKLDKSKVCINPCFVEWMMGYPKNWTKTH